MAESVDTKVDTKDDILAELDKDDVKDEEIEIVDSDDKTDEEPIEKDAKDEKDEEEIKVENEDEDEEEKPKSDDELELVVPVKLKDLRAKYPNITKEFPWLKTVIYREKAYAEILPTMEDARDAVKKGEILDDFEKDLSNGDLTSALNGVKHTSPEAFGKLVDNYLEILAKVDPAAQQHVVSNVIKRAIIMMAREGKAADDETLMSSAHTLNKFIFGTSEFEPPKRISKDEDKESEKLRSEREQFHKEKFESIKSDIVTKTNNRLKATIDTNIDPRDSMTPYVKSKAIEDAIRDLESRMQSDTRFNTTINRLWEQAKKDNYSKITLDRISSAYIQQARTYLSPVIQKARAEALKGLGKVKKDEVKREDKEMPRRSASSLNSGKKVEIPKGMTTREFLDLD